jgi:DNA-binding MarR family transcriptional regulator
LSRYSSEKIADLLREHAAAALRYSAALARQMGLGISEVAALEHLHSAGELTPKQLGERLFMSSGAVTALVDRLERGGHLERVPNPRDRRSSLLRPTPWGIEEVVEQILPLAAEVHKLSEDLSEEERAVIGRFMEAATTAYTKQAQKNRPKDPQ